MKKLVVPILLLIIIAGGALFYVFRPRPAEDLYTPAQIKAMDYKKLHELAIACEAKTFEENCTLIMEVLALKAQHARQGETFWVNQMLRLGKWYGHVGVQEYKAGAPDAPEIKKANDVYDWLMENKPFFGDQVLLGRAKLYDTAENDAWRAAHKAEALENYEKLRQRFPMSKSVTEATEAVARLQ